MKLFIILFFLNPIWLMAQTINIPCMIDKIQVGSLEGQINTLLQTLVSKEPQEKLSPLAQPKPLRPIPLVYINPMNQNYYRKINQTEYLVEDAAIQSLSLIQKANKNGIKLFIHSAYRSYHQQCDVFRSKVLNEMKISKINLEAAIKAVNLRSAFPGESEHQLATTIDFVGDYPQLGYTLKYEFAKTGAYQWLEENAEEFGFVLSYPLNQSGVASEANPKTQIVFEPWHWRYIGVRWAQAYTTCKTQMTSHEFLRQINKNPNYICSK